MGLDRDGWKRAEWFGEKLPYSICPDSVDRWLKGQPEGARLVVACSGGADSVGLLLWLLGHLRTRFEWVVAHIDHGTRGDASAGDAQFVGKLAAEMGLDFESRSLVSASTSEGDLRKIRWEALGEMVETRKAAGVFLGHHQDDVVENLLFRMARGAGLEGISGMRAVQVMEGGVPRIRPLLNCRREGLRTALREVGQDWREDASNQVEAYLRNRVRKYLLPAMDEVFEGRDWRDGFRRTHGQLDEAFRCIQALAERWAEKGKGNQLERGALAQLAVAVQRRVIEQWVIELIEQVPGDRLMAELLKTLGDGGTGKWSLGKGFLEITETELRWTEKGAEATEEWRPKRVGIPFEESLSGGGRIRGERMRMDGAKYLALKSGAISEVSEVWLDAAKVGDRLELRPKRAGDHYVPLGTKGHKKLQDAMVERKVERSKRSVLPVVCRVAGEILWVPGLLPSELYKLEPETEFALRLTYEQG